MKRVNDLLRAEYHRADWQDRPIFFSPRRSSGLQALGRHLRGVVQRITAGIRRSRDRRATYRELAALDDRLLEDIGLTRAQLWGLTTSLRVRQKRTEESATVTPLPPRGRRSRPVPGARGNRAA